MSPSHSSDSQLYCPQKGLSWWIQDGAVSICKAFHPVRLPRGVSRSFGRLTFSPLFVLHRPLLALSTPLSYLHILLKRIRPLPPLKALLRPLEYLDDMQASLYDAGRFNRRAMGILRSTAGNALLKWPLLSLSERSLHSNKQINPSNWRALHSPSSPQLGIQSLIISFLGAFLANYDR